MKKEPGTKLDKFSSDENSSPVRKPANGMMMNWLNKSASKKSDSSSIENKTTIKKIDSNSQSIQTKKDDYTKVELKAKEKTSPKAEIKKKVAKISDYEDESSDDEEPSPIKLKAKKAKSEKAKAEKKVEKVEKPEKKSKSSPKLTPEKKETSKASETKRPANKFYAAYMRREGPKNPGSKPIPIGKKDCFAGLKFLVTGVLDSLDRDDCKKLVEKYAGSMISGVTKKLDYLIVGEDAGQSKLEKAKELNVKQINEDEFLNLICKKSGITNPKYENNEVEMMSLDDNEEKVKIESVETEEHVLSKTEKDKTTIKKEQIKKEIKSSPKEPKTENIKQEPKINTEMKLEEKPIVINELWVDKYKPQAMNKIIGQSTEKSNANKLFNWLKNWQKWHGPNSDPKAKKGWNDQDTGSSFKAALLSGPPGIGKTTTAQVVCKEAGYTYVELNASDSRSKKLLEKVLGESTENASIDSYFKQKHKVTDLSKDKHCIIMDEVDGMAGNEDRGGVQELIGIIKQSKIPIICICNDRQHIKIRSLANYCFDLRFYKPRLEQVRAALMSVCFKEGIKITPDLLDQIIIGCNYDIRQCLHNLSMWSSNNKVMTSNQKSKVDIEKAMKDIRMNPFEACKLVFNADPSNNRAPKNINEKLDLFFTDYSLMPLLVHENYLSVTPSTLKGSTKKEKERNHLELLNESIASICQGDRISKILRNNNNWSLLPTQAVFSTLIPGEKLQGNIGLPAFPSWFGKNSKQGRVDRILQELQKHMRIHISANKLGVGMDYLGVLKQMLTKPLIKKGNDGIQSVINLMNDYSLTRDDFDTIVELATWPNQKDTMSLIDSKVKAAFTRAYNKESHKNPFTIVNVKKLKATKLSDDYVEGDEVEEEEEEDNDDISADAMIKVNTKKTKAATASSTSKASTAKATKRTAKSNDDTEAKPSASKRKKT